MICQNSLNLWTQNRIIQANQMEALHPTWFLNTLRYTIYQLYTKTCIKFISTLHFTSKVLTSKHGIYNCQSMYTERSIDNFIILHVSFIYSFCDLLQSLLHKIIIIDIK